MGKKVGRETEKEIAWNDWEKVACQLLKPNLFEIHKVIIIKKKFISSINDYHGNGTRMLQAILYKSWK